MRARTRLFAIVTWGLLLGGSVGACGGEAEGPGTSGAGGVITGVGTATGAGGASSSGPSASNVSTTVGAGGGGGMVVQPCSDEVSSEPNDSIGTAWKMSEDKLDDCATDNNPVSVSGTIAGADDVDWYWYEGDDGVGPCVDPGRSLVQSESGIRICKYLECKVGEETFVCPEGTTVAQEDGRDGCCGTGDFDIPDLDCSGTLDDAANVYIRIDQPGASATTCNAYTLSVDF